MLRHCTVLLDLSRNTVEATTAHFCFYGISVQCERRADAPSAAAALPSDHYARSFLTRCTSLCVPAEKLSHATSVAHRKTSRATKPSLARVRARDPMKTKNSRRGATQQTPPDNETTLKILSLAGLPAGAAPSLWALSWCALPAAQFHHQGNIDRRPRRAFSLMSGACQNRCAAASDLPGDFS